MPATQGGHMLTVCEERRKNRVSHGAEDKAIRQGMECSSDLHRPGKSDYTSGMTRPICVCAVNPADSTRPLPSTCRNAPTTRIVWGARKSSSGRNESCLGVAAV